MSYQILAAVLALGAFVLPGCRNSLVDRSLIFATHTNLGLEVAINPVEASSPAKLQIGYQRGEYVVNPVYHNLDVACKEGSPGSRTADDYYRSEAFSVIAKFEGNVKGGAAAESTASTPMTDTEGKPTGGLNSTVKGGLAVSQWFATGEAAKLLARYGGIPNLSDNPGVAAATSLGRGLTLFDSDVTIPLIVSSVMSQLYVALGDMDQGVSSPEIKTEAKRIVSDLDRSPLVKKVPATLTYYITLGESSEYVSQVGSYGSEQGFGKVRSYWLNLDTSVRSLETIRGWLDEGKEVKTDGKVINATDAEKELRNALTEQRKTRDLWQDMIRKDPAVRGMFEFFAGRGE